MSEAALAEAAEAAVAEVAVAVAAARVAYTSLLQLIDDQGQAIAISLLTDSLCLQQECNIVNKHPKITLMVSMSF